jgi:RNA polymerase subunit RPABC4/transcription elongation factor Spt4
MNSNSHSVWIYLNVNTLFTSQTTETVTATSYLTTSSTWPTQTLVTSQHVAGLGSLFFLGAALLVVGVVLGFFYVRSRGERATRNTRLHEDVAASAATVAAPGSEIKADTSATAVTYCGQCGAQIPKDSRFCTVCGTKEELSEPTTVNEIEKADHSKSTMFCTQCRAKIPRDSKFCKECGNQQS